MRQFLHETVFTSESLGSLHALDFRLMGRRGLSNPQQGGVMGALGKGVRRSG